MRVSIWQQYSSNHSGSVTIVGTFESSEEADQAAAKLDGILKEVGAWFEQHQDPLNPPPRDAPPSPGEIDLLRRLKLPTDKSFDFTEDVRCSLSTAAAGRLVIVRIGETWNEPPAQVIRLIEGLGGAQVCSEFEVDGDYITVVNVHLTCTAPDAATAEAITAPIQAYFADPHAYEGELFPWEGGEREDARGTVTRDGSRLVFDLRFFRIKDGLPCFVDFLKSKGCTAINYTLAEKFAPGTYWDWR